MTKLEMFINECKKFDKLNEEQKSKVENINILNEKIKKIFVGIKTPAGSLNSRIKDCSDCLKLYAIKNNIHSYFKRAFKLGELEVIEENEENEYI